jgi:hypothetical protein
MIGSVPAILVPQVTSDRFLSSELAVKRAKMENPKHWWLRTSDIRPVFTDQKGNYKVEWEPGYIVVEFTEGQLPAVDMEKLAKEISDKLNIQCQWIFQPK